ncbi:MAG: glycosyltransferase, partial [Bryobacteraceae bacterium]
RNVLNAEPDPEWAEYRRRVTAGLLACDAIVAPSEFMAREIEREYGVGGEKIRIIHNFSARQPVSRRDKEPFLLAAGRVWDAAKNFALLEKIAPSLEWPVKLAGKNKGESRSADPLQRLGHVTTAELLDLMARASVFVHPAFYEPFGLSVLDAARSGCCLVLADTSSLRELWGDAAVFLDPRHPVAWVRELNSLSRDPERCQELGQRAYAHAERYSANTTAQAYTSLYGNLINRAGKGAEEAA